MAGRQADHTEVCGSNIRTRPRGIFFEKWLVSKIASTFKTHVRLLFKKSGMIWNSWSVKGLDRRTPGPPTGQNTHWAAVVYPLLADLQKCFVVIQCFTGRFYNSGNECNWTNTEQLVFTKPCPQKGFMKTAKYVFQTFHFRWNLTGTKPQFPEIFRYYITEAEIIQNRGFRSTLKGGVLGTSLADLNPAKKIIRKV